MPSDGAVSRDDLKECWCCDGLHDSPGTLCPNCDDAGCNRFTDECVSDHKPALTDGGVDQDDGEIDQRFRVDHRPERISLSGTGCLWDDCGTEEAVVVSVHAATGEQQRSRVCETHLNDLRARTGVSVEVKNVE